jgi:hypothetical protein
MSTMSINFERQFQIWKYVVGHRQLLLRSVKSARLPTRVDVFFKGVKEFHLPTSLTGLSITEASEADIRQLCTLRKSPSLNSGDKVFKVQGVDFLGYIIALIAVCHEDEGEYDDPSFFAESSII